MPDLLIRNATIVCADSAGRVIAPGWLAVLGGRIAALGPMAETPPTAAETLDAAGAILMPGLINAHCHLADSLFRGLVEDLPLEPWLQTVWKAEAAILNPDTVRLGATLGLAELALSGVTTVMDMFWHPDQAVAAARAVGMRIATGGIFFDAPGTDGRDPAGRAADAEAFFAAHQGADDVIPGTFPHGAYTVGPDALGTAHRLAAERGALFHTHAAETRAEVNTIEARYGTRVIRHLDALGVLDGRTTLAHCVWLEDDEIETLARRGAHVAHNPLSNLKLASGFARVPDMLAAGVTVALGTDGAISGNDLDMWLAMRLAATLHKGATGRADAVTTGQALAMATLNGARALGVADRLGSLEPGKAADMILVETAAPHAVPLFDPLTHLVYSASKSDVAQVWVGGRRIVRDRRLVGIDLAATLDAVRALTPRIAESIR